MKISLIISVDSEIDRELVESMVNLHRRVLDGGTEIIVSSYGYRDDISLCDRLVSSPGGGVFSLSVTRNNGARASSHPWLAFTDIDVCFADMLPEMADQGYQVVRGVTRQDVQELGEAFTHNGPFYQCANSPILISRSLFEHVGGYCERYHGWGYEDSDFEHKIDVPILDYDSRSSHILLIHDVVSGNPGWNHGSDQNREFYRKRRDLSKEERLVADREDYFR